MARGHRSAAGVDASTHVAGTRAPVGAGRPLAVDVGVLDALIGQLGEAGTGLRLMLWHTYLAEGGRHVARLSAAAARDDAEAVRGLAHQLKSSSALLGARPLAALLQQVEDAAGDGRFGLVPLVAAAAAEYARVAAVAAELYGTPA